MGSAPAPGAANDALVVGLVRRDSFYTRWNDSRVFVCREGATNSSRGGCAPQTIVNF